MLSAMGPAMADSAAARLCAVLSVAASLPSLCSPCPAAAHGRPAALGQLVASPEDPNRLVARGTWGLAISLNGGATWRWSCAAAYGVDARNEDPPLTVFRGGRLAVATFEGVFVSDGTGCDWGRPTGAPANTFVIDVVRGASSDEGYLVATAFEVDDRIFRTRDAGMSWQPVGDPIAGVLVDRIRAAPSDERIVYLSAAMPARAGEAREVFTLRSGDAGESFARRLFALEPGETNLLLEGVDAADPSRLYARVTHFGGELEPERVVRSIDGGDSWETILRIPDVGGVVFDADGALFVGSRLGGVHRSSDGGDTFEQVSSLTARCLMASEGSLWLCNDEAVDGRALSRSSDSGGSFAPVVKLREIVELLPCPACSEVGYTCPAWSPDVAFDLGLDAGVDAGFSDAGTGAPRDAEAPALCLADGGTSPTAPSGCACRAASSRAEPTEWLGLGALLWLWRRRRGVRLGVDAGA